jgi:phage terminase large subunit
MKAKLPPVVVAQEIDLDYSASVEGILIPAEWVRSCIDAHTRLGIVPTGSKQASLDVADAGMDSNALCGTHGILVECLEVWSGAGSDIFATAQKAFEICDTKGYATLEYDGDGLGAGIRGDARVINEKRVTIGKKAIHIIAFRGSSSVHRPESCDIKGLKNEDAFSNRKSQGWWALRGRIERTYRWVVEGKPCDPDEILSISSSLKHYRDLVVELSQPTYSLNGTGKIKIDKAPDGSKSPNLADSLMIRFGSAPHTPMVVSQAAVSLFASTGRARR